MALQIRPVSVNWTDQFTNPAKYEASVRANLVNNNSPVIQKQLAQTPITPQVQQAARQQNISIAAPVVAQPKFVQPTTQQAAPDIWGTVGDFLAVPGLNRIGNSIAETIAEMNGTNQKIRDQKAQQDQQDLELIKHYGKVIHGNDPAAAARARTALASLMRTSDTADKDFQQRQAQIADAVDLPKLAGAIADVGLTYGTLGIGGAATKAAVATGKIFTKQAAKEAAISAALSSAGGVASTYEQQGAQAKPEDVLTNALVSGAIGAAVPTVGRAAGKFVKTAKEVHASDTNPERGSVKLPGGAQQPEKPKVTTVNPYSKEGTGKPLTDDKNLLRVKLNNVKDPVRQKELQAEWKDKYGSDFIKRAKVDKSIPANEVLNKAEEETVNRYKGNIVANKRDDFVRNVTDPYGAGSRSDDLVSKAEFGNIRGLPASRRITKLVGDFRNSEAQAYEKAKSLKLENGKTLQDVVSKYQGKDEKDFLRFAALLSDNENRLAKGTPIHNNLSNKQVADAVKEYVSVHGKDAIDDARTLKYFKDQMEREGVGNTLKQADVDRAIASREYYFPTRALESDELIRPEVRGGIKTTRADQDILKSRKGTDRPVDYSWQAVMDRFTKDVKQNNESRLFSELSYRAENNLLGKSRRVAFKGNRIGEYDQGNQFGGLSGLTEGAAGRNILRGLRDGDKDAIELDRDIAKMLENLSTSEKRSVVNDIANVPANVAKIMFTGAGNPVFAALSPVKNLPVLLHNQGLGVVGVRPLISSFGGAFNRGKFSEKGLVEYGANTVKATKNAASARSHIKADILAAKDVSSVARFTLNHPVTSAKEAFRVLDHIMSAPDRALRSMAARQAYQKAKRGGATEEGALKEAAYMYNESMGNFNRVTQMAKDVEPILLYSGATQAGARRFMRAYKEHPMQTLLVDAAFVGAAGMLTAEGYKQNKEFYDDMIKSGKQYELDSNLIIMTPFASHDEKTGEWKGVVKIPLAPDFQPLNRAVWKTVMGKTPDASDLIGHFTGDVVNSASQIPTNNPGVAALSVGMNRNPRTGEDIVTPYEKTRPVNEQVDDKYTSGFAKWAGSSLNIAPKKIDAWLDNYGLAGDVVQAKGGDTPVDVVRKAFLRKFGDGLKGDSQGAKFYKGFKEAASGFDNEKDFQTFAALHTKDDDKSLFDAPARANALLSSKEVLDAEIKLNQKAVARGEQSNPLFDDSLTPEQRDKVLLYRSNKAMNAAKQNYDKNGNPLFTSLGMDEKWYSDFKAKEDAYWDKVNAAGNTSNSTESPKTFSGETLQKSDDVKAMESVYYQLPSGTGQRSAFLKANPGLLDFWAKQNEFTNKERDSLGLKPVDSSSSSGSSYSGYSRYGSRSSGSSSSGINPYAYQVKRRASTASLKVSATKKAAKAKVASKKSVSKPKVSLKKAKA